VRLKLLLAVLLAMSGIVVGGVSEHELATICAYDAAAVTRVDVGVARGVEAYPALPSDARGVFALQPAEAQGGSTTPDRSVVATNVADDVLRSVDDVTGGLSPGRQPHVRTVSSPGGLQTVYDDLATGGVPTEWSGYKGTVVRRPDGVEVGIRGSSTSGGATIDIRLPDGTTQKVHIAG
jgi:hypothetical protein